MLIVEGVDKVSNVCYGMYILIEGDTIKATSKRVKLSQTTWVLGDTNTDKYGLTWCNRVPRGKRNKPAKINGIQHHEIDTRSVAHSYYQPLH